MTTRKKTSPADPGVSPLSALMKLPDKKLVQTILDTGYSLGVMPGAAIVDEDGWAAAMALALKMRRAWLEEAYAAKQAKKRKGRA